jgi:hypothetical protein
MDFSALLGVIGIAVSIGVGFGTFYIADNRARRSRWQNAKDIVLRDLSKSLGEGNVPDAFVIKATIRSVLRGQNTSNLSAVTLEEISDDLLRQITADPFLDPERRKQLQNDVIKLKEAQTQHEEAMSPEQREAEAVTIEAAAKLSWQTASSLLAGIMASIIAAASLNYVKPLLEFIKQTNSDGLAKGSAAFIAAVVTVLLSILSIFLSRHEKKKKEK